MVRIGLTLLGAAASLGTMAMAAAQMPAGAPAASAGAPAPLPGDHGRGANVGIFPDPARRAAMAASAAASAASRPAPPKTPAPPIDLALEAVREVAATCKQYPLGAAVVNAKGEPILVYIPDGSNSSHAFTAVRKAYSAITYAAPTSTMVAKGQTDAAFAARVKADPNLLAYSGGVPLTMGGQIVGAIGVSGAEPGSHDEECALNGVRKIADRMK